MFHTAPIPTDQVQKKIVHNRRAKIKTVPSQTVAWKMPVRKLPSKRQTALKGYETIIALDQEQNEQNQNKQTQTLVQMHELNSLCTPIVSALWIWGSAIPK